MNDFGAQSKIRHPHSVRPPFTPHNSRDPHHRRSRTTTLCLYPLPHGTTPPNLLVTPPPKDLITPTAQQRLLTRSQSNPLFHPLTVLASPQTIKQVNVPHRLEMKMPAPDVPHAPHSLHAVFTRAQPPLVTHIRALMERHVLPACVNHSAHVHVTPNHV